MLQYITNSKSTASPVEQVKGVISGGCRWVQVDMRDASDEEIAKVIEEIKPLCIETETFLLLTDRVELAKTLDVGGVYLHKGGILPSRARLDLGPAAVVGVSVNTIEDIMAVRSLDVDFVGMEPFRICHDSPAGANALGIEGVTDLSMQMDRMELEMGRVAYGGIRLDDVVPLMQAGANGIAVSDTIANADNIEKKTREFLDRLLPFMKADGMKKIE